MKLTLCIIMNTVRFIQEGQICAEYVSGKQGIVYSRIFVTKTTATTLIL
jgi:hypothetical protein